MHVIVPLAGPDFIRSDGSVKALIPYRGKPLLKYILDSRPWSSLVTNYSFIMLDSFKTRNLVEQHLKDWYPNSSFTFLSSFTRGAALSALAGISTIQDFSKPVIIDLADIYYVCCDNVEELLNNLQKVGAIAFTFNSSNSAYSYLKCDSNGSFLEAAEKSVISNNASAGTYVFKNCSILLSAISHALQNEKTQTYNKLFYVCPLFNGVHAQNEKVILRQVTSVDDIKCLE